ncbi:MAG: pitrilysin family protein [Campylobacterota bacterium]|nr:pitrilysin family protein [Campylobacterota bacterium]
MKILITILILGYTIMAATVQTLHVDGTKIPLIHEKDKRLPLISLQLVFKNSGAITTPLNAGLAKLSAKMLNEGSKKLGSVEFSQALDDKAIHLSAHAGNETLVVELSSLKDQFNDGVALLQELLYEPNLSEEAFKKVQTMTLGSISQKVNDFDYVASASLKKVLFDGTPMQEPQIGTLESVQKIRLNDVKKFIKSHIILENAIFVIGGDVSKSDALNSALKIAKSLKQGKSEKLGFYNATTQTKDEVTLKPTQQAYIYFGSPYYVKVDDESRYISNVAMFILGSSGFGSRLMEEIRVKRGLAYSAYSRAHISNTSSYFSGHLQTKIESQKEAIDAVKEVVSKFIKKGATKTELKQAKKFLLGSEPLRNETISQRLSRSFNEFYQGKELGSHKKDLELIEKLKLKDLNRFISEHKELLELSFAIVDAPKE